MVGVGLRFLRNAVARSSKVVLGGCTVLGLGGCMQSVTTLATAPVGQVFVPEAIAADLFIRRGCTFIQGRGYRYFVVWPEGTHLHNNRKAIVAEDGRIFESGQRVRLRGGETSIEAFAKSPSDRLIMESCGGPFFLSNKILEGEGQ